MNDLLENESEISDFESELVGYLNERRRDIDTDPLLYWRDAPWPCLRAMARDYLAIMATTAPIKQVFSLAGNIANPRHRNQISKVHINQLVCLRS